MKTEYVKWIQREDPRWWERVALWFCRRRSIVVRWPMETVLVYKLWRGRMWVVDFYYRSPYHVNCRCIGD